MRLLQQSISGVYPRVGGGTGRTEHSPRNHGGLSPRGRGNPTRMAISYLGDGSIPAWAGEPLTRRSLCPWPWVYPRVGGGTEPGEVSTKGSGGLSPRGRGTVTVHNSILEREGLSPRGRGNRWPDDIKSQYVGSIPAWAGEP